MNDEVERALPRTKRQAIHAERTLRAPALWHCTCDLWLLEAVVDDTWLFAMLKSSKSLSSSTFSSSLALARPGAA